MNNYCMKTLALFSGGKRDKEMHFFFFFLGEGREHAWGERGAEERERENLKPAPHPTIAGLNLTTLTEIMT